jgi:hypothetical protein
VPSAEQAAEKVRKADPSATKVAEGRQKKGLRRGAEEAVTKLSVFEQIERNVAFKFD